MQNTEKEAVYYNVVNIALQTEYGRLRKLKAQFGNWESVWRQIQPEFPGIDPDSEWQKLENLGIDLILLENEKYPNLLREIPNPPLGIYLRGTLPPAESIAIVGTRKATEEGKATAEEFAQCLSEAGLGVISGLAFGIDAAAHEGALQAKCKTWAVLANGVDKIYPSLHTKLGIKILESGGGIISEFPPGSPPFPYRFLARNRIVSGLSLGTLVIEAPQNSGALVTARFTLDQNRELFVIPGPITHNNFRGSHNLIRCGAELVTSPEDILVSLGISEGRLKENIPSSNEEKIILQILAGAKHALDIDKIIELANLNAQIVNQAITFLTISGKIKEESGGYILTETQSS